jgi:SAM-dependent methyltransferase
MTNAPAYDRIGRTYTATRRPDPRIAMRISDALGDATRVVSVGAGTGSYEDDRTTIAIEPAATMIRQRSVSAAPAVQAVAEALPLRDDSFDAALASLTIHHWTDWRRGIDEMRRVARRTVIFTFEPDDVGNFWLTEEYFPEIPRMDVSRTPTIADLREHLDNADDIRVPVPQDCVDGFLAAFWRRPERYLDPDVRAGISGFAMLDTDVVERGVAKLAADLESGAWDERFGSLCELDELDVCYRLVVAER